MAMACMAPLPRNRALNLFLKVLANVIICGSCFKVFAINLGRRFNPLTMMVSCTVDI
jgi:hypothetical protein